jgi:hypothetical protein
MKKYKTNEKKKQTNAQLDNLTLNSHTDILSTYWTLFDYRYVRVGLVTLTVNGCQLKIELFYSKTFVTAKRAHILALLIWSRDVRQSKNETERSFVFLVKETIIFLWAYWVASIKWSIHLRFSHGHTHSISPFYLLRLSSALSQYELNMNDNQDEIIPN